MFDNTLCLVQSNNVVTAINRAQHFNYHLFLLQKEEQLLIYGCHLLELRKKNVFFFNIY